MGNKCLYIIRSAVEFQGRIPLFPIFQKFTGEVSYIELAPWHVHLSEPSIQSSESLNMAASDLAEYTDSFADERKSSSVSAPCSLDAGHGEQATRFSSPKIQWWTIHLE